MSIILKPFALLVSLFYNITNSYGWAIILFAIVLKVILFPFSLKGKKSMVKTTMLQAQATKIQKQYAKNKQKQQEELQKLCAKEGVSPMSGCLWSFIPLLVLIPLYAIIRQPLQHLMSLSADQVNEIAKAVGFEMGNGAYNELFLAGMLKDPALLAKAQAAVPAVFAMNFQFLGMDLSQVPQLQFWTQAMTWNNIGLFLMPIVSGVLSVGVTIITNKTNNLNGGAAAGKGTNMFMYLFMPLISLCIGYSMPAGLCVYWIINSLLSVVQELICAALLKKDYAAAAEAKKKQELLDKEEEKRRKAALAEERARRAADKKKKGGAKKKEKAELPAGVDASASRVGIRAYARGRAYDPDRFGGVTAYKDPNAAIDEDAIEKALEAKAEARERAAEEAEIEAAVQAKVDAEMRQFQGETAQEVAEKLEEAHANEPELPEPEELSGEDADPEVPAEEDAPAGEEPAEETPEE